MTRWTWTTIGDLRPGAIFETASGARAVKSDAELDGFDAHTTVILMAAITGHQQGSFGAGNV